MKFKPKKYLGQNFLRDKNVLKRVLEAGELEKEDVVLEIGPGTGILTELLVQKAKKVVAIERDGQLADVLREKFKDYKNIEIIEGDIRKFKIPADFEDSRFKIVANIPYYLTGFIIRNFFLELENPPELIVLMVQREVARRIAARSPQNNFLSVAIGYLADVKFVKSVPASAFWPKPKVDSAIIQIKTKEKIPSLEKRRRFFIFLRAIFRQPRKTLMNNLMSSFKISKGGSRTLGSLPPKDKIIKILEDAGLKEKVRAAELSLEDMEIIHSLLDEIK